MIKEKATSSVSKRCGQVLLPDRPEGGIGQSREKQHKSEMLFGLSSVCMEMSEPGFWLGNVPSNEPVM